MQFIDLSAQYLELKHHIDAKIDSVLKKGQFIMGEEVGQLEDKLKKFTGRKHCITCANGTDALQILYMAYGLNYGDAVFCPDVTFIASIEPACLLGAVPVFCDIDPNTYNIDCNSLENQIQKVLNEGKLNPKIVVAVDFLGNPAAFEQLDAICRKYGLILIEDAAQGIGASYRGNRCGSFGQASTTSFFPAKPLGCYGDGGAIFTDDDEIANICESIRNHGKGTSKYDNVRIGLNSRLDTIQAAILQVKLEALVSFEIEKRKIVAERYDLRLGNVLKTPFVEAGCQSIYAQYALCANSREEREALIEKLNRKNIPNMIYYPAPIHQLKVFRDYGFKDEDYPSSINYCTTTFSIPMHAYLSEPEQDYIIDTILGKL